MAQALVTALVAEITPAQRLRCSRLADPATFREALARRPVRKTEHFGLHVLRSGSATVRAAASLAQESWQIGAVIPKRAARRAVTRNAVRRRIYVVADQNLQALAAQSFPTPTAITVVVRLVRGWGTDELRSATHTHWQQQLSAELARLFDGGTWLERT